MRGVVSDFIWITETRNRSRGKKGRTRGGTRTAALTVLVVSILIALCLLFVASRLWVVSLGYKTSQALKEQNELLEENRKLRIERATLISPERIEAYARRRLGMGEPEENQIRFVP